jgi:hypothetical protein
MTQLATPSSVEDEVHSTSGCPAKNFDTQRMPNLQPLVDESGAAAIVGARADGHPAFERPARSGCNQTEEEPSFADARKACMFLHPPPYPASIFPMRRIVPRSRLSENPREFVLAALLFTVAALLLAGFAVTTLSGPGGDLGSARLAYTVIGWGKYLAALRLLYVADRATLRHGYLGWKRTALLWLPLVLFIAYAYLQWMVIGHAIDDYLVRAARPGPGPARYAVFMAIAFPIAFALTAVNALWIQRRQLRVAL